ncbi:MAG: ABC transporter ATP-binding protein [Ardenticatenaceae bacterium]|nr:ABC transporter ATP-binding protein [Anaerolineales bacterium]MCB9007862.1 ABC transporter ATP-binding protein [Ardenticatenaceae bacterium]
MIEIHNVGKQFFSLKALDNVSVQVGRGEVVGLLGPNGAGKTTLFKLIAGVLHPDSGQIRPINGRWPAIGYKPDRLLFPNRLRVSDYLMMVANLCGIPPAAQEKAVFDVLVQVDMVSQANKRIGDCSKGMRQRLGLAQAIMGDPPLLLLDEPSNGLDPNGQAEMQILIKKLHATGKTIVISSHQLEEITAVCTQLIILNNGQVHYQNSMVEALTISPHTLIQADRDLAEIAPIVQAQHPEIRVQGNKIQLRGEAMKLRREILALLLQSQYDVLHVEQKHVTLAEIYARAVR